MLTSALEQLDARFARLVLGNVSLETLYRGCRWSEGPAYFAAGRYLLWSRSSPGRPPQWRRWPGR